MQPGKKVEELVACDRVERGILRFCCPFDCAERCSGCSSAQNASQIDREFCEDRTIIANGVRTQAGSALVAQEPVARLAE